MFCFSGLESLINLFYFYRLSNKKKKKMIQIDKKVKINHTRYAGFSIPELCGLTRRRSTCKIGVQNTMCNEKKSNKYNLNIVYINTTIINSCSVLECISQMTIYRRLQNQNRNRPSHTGRLQSNKQEYFSFQWQILKHNLIQMGTDYVKRRRKKQPQNHFRKKEMISQLQCKMDYCKSRLISLTGESDSHNAYQENRVHCRVWLWFYCACSDFYIPTNTPHLINLHILAV